MACILAGIVLLLSFAATSPALHSALHGKDADLTCSGACVPGEHSAPGDGEWQQLCAVLLLMAGTLLALPVTAPPFIQIRTAEIVKCALVVTSEEHLRLYNSRAPPRG